MFAECDDIGCRRLGIKDILVFFFFSFLLIVQAGDSNLKLSVAKNVCRMFR
jgi:hypothetical protein